MKLTNKKTHQHKIVTKKQNTNVNCRKRIREPLNFISSIHRSKKDNVTRKWKQEEKKLQKPQRSIARIAKSLNIVLRIQMNYVYFALQKQTFQLSEISKLRIHLKVGI